jgi:hypothetical protein
MASLMGAIMILLFDIFGGARWIMGLRDTSVLLFMVLTLLTVASLGTFYLILAAWPSSEFRALLSRGISRFRKT